MLIVSMMPLDTSRDWEHLQEKFYADYGGEEEFSFRSGSPVLGRLNSGMQLYRIKYERPALFERIHRALHLPQYLSFLVSGQTFTDMTSIGCHTNLWDFTKNDYHDWVAAEGLSSKFAPIVGGDQVFPASFPGNNYGVGVGLHDSSSALIPYLVNFDEPFVLISTGTWCISLNPFNRTPLTASELQSDCLNYISYKGVPVKASRLFAGYVHEQHVKRIADYFEQSTAKYRTMPYNRALMRRLRETQPQGKAVGDKVSAFGMRELSDFATDVEAYHQLVADLVALQRKSTTLIINGGKVKRIFVDGGFSKNQIYMSLLAESFPDMEVYAASMAQATAVGAALAIHDSWNNTPPPADLIALRFYDHNLED